MKTTSQKCDFCGNNIAPAKYETHSKGGMIFKGETIPMPFTCRRCGGTFCADCRLPEQHDCLGLKKNRITISLNDIIIKDDLKEQSIDNLEEPLMPVNKSVITEEKIKITKSFLCKLGIHRYERIHQPLNNTHGRVKYRKCKICGKEQWLNDNTQIWEN